MEGKRQAMELQRNIKTAAIQSPRSKKKGTSFQRRTAFSAEVSFSNSSRSQPAVFVSLPCLPCERHRPYITQGKERGRFATPIQNQGMWAKLGKGSRNEGVLGLVQDVEGEQVHEFLRDLIQVRGWRDALEQETQDVLAFCTTAQP